nr:Phospho-2-dehydro-3-deoxyheptonate aldolase, Tyr-sensitive [Chlamydiota bacterium]
MAFASLCNVSAEESIPSPDELLAEIPLSSSQKAFVQRSRKSVEAILDGRDDRLLMIVGPCSIHSEQSAYAYAERFARLAEEVSDRFFLVMRAYMEKPRTCGGWKGLIFDPDLNGSNNMSKGLSLSRKILIELTESQIPLGCEFLEINTSLFFSDAITWGCVGA